MEFGVINIVVFIFIAIATGTLEIVFHNTNELISALSSFVQAICIIFQSILLFKQLKLDEKVEQRTQEESKGIFILDKTNMGDNDIYNNKYNLNQVISFHNVGNDHVILRSIRINEIMIDGWERTFFTNLERYSKLEIDLKLDENDLQKNEIKFKIDLELENLKGYTYIESMDIEFIKDIDKKIYNLNLFNIKLN